MLYAIVGTILKNKRIHLHHRMHFVTFANPRQMHAILIMLLTVAGIGLLGLTFAGHSLILRRCGH
jgi:GTPase involved in cell partitioning and DNA repair